MREQYIKNQKVAQDIHDAIMKNFPLYKISMDNTGAAITIQIGFGPGIAVGRRVKGDHRFDLVIANAMIQSSLLYRDDDVEYKEVLLTPEADEILKLAVDAVYESHLESGGNPDMIPFMVGRYRKILSEKLNEATDVNQKSIILNRIQNLEDFWIIFQNREKNPLMEKTVLESFHRNLLKIKEEIDNIEA